MCIDRMPRSGPLFTSQSPFFPVFVMGLVSHRLEHRRIVRKWFEEVLSRAPARSVSDQALQTTPRISILLIETERPSSLASASGDLGLDG
jgi:hypothetical protein